MDKQKVITELEREIEFYSEHTRRQYRAHVGDYLRFVGNRNWQDRDVLYNYIEKLRKKGRSQNHITYLVRGPLGALFRAHGLRVPVKLPKFRGVQVDLTARVSFDFQDVVKLIQAVRTSGNQQWQAIMALSTIWGLRAGEIRQLTKKDVRAKDHTIMIYTTKGGMPREHLIPDEVYPILTAYDFPPLSESGVFDLFTEISEYAGVARVSKKVYHAIRHTVLTQLLLNGVEEVIAKQFLRWRIAGIVGVYFTPKAIDIDERVYPKHPFLKYWS